jgi:tRNA threonylcarbamoyladenosine biosynthesis protein TsaE
LREDGAIGYNGNTEQGKRVRHLKNVLTQWFICPAAEDTEALGRRLAAGLRAGQLVAFTGGLGAGKTTFCRGMAKGLGCVDPVSSPTFAIANVYRGPVVFAHFDAYRIGAPQDLEEAGFYDYLRTGAVVAMEWSENIAGWTDEPDVRVEIVPQPDGSRRIGIEGAGLAWG